MIGGCYSIFTLVALGAALGVERFHPTPPSQECCSYINFATPFTVQTAAQNILGNRIFVKYGRVTTQLCRQMMCSIIQEECH